MNKRLLLVVVILVSVITGGYHTHQFSTSSNFNGDSVKPCSFSNSNGDTVRPCYSLNSNGKQTDVEKSPLDTTFFGKTVWDWLNLLAVGAVPIVIAIFG